MKNLTTTLIVVFLLTSLTTAQTNYSLSFDGVDDHVNCGNDTSLNVLDDFTIEVWFKLNEWGSDETAGYSYIVGKTSNIWINGFLIYLNSDANDFYGEHSLVFRVVVGDLIYLINTQSNSIQLNEWQHLAITFSDGSVFIYLNGLAENLFLQVSDIDGNLSEVASFTGSITDHSDGELYIGNRNDLIRIFKGSIDEVRIWDTVRSETEITENILNDLTGAENGLVGYWNFNEGTGTTAEDVSPNTNDGVITGAVYSTDLHPIVLALFSSDRYIQLPPHGVQFTDYSLPQDSIVSWNWDFGDGTTSTEQNPIHSYTYDSTYTVSLTVTDIHDSFDTHVIEDLIMVYTEMATITSPTAEAQYMAYNYDYDFSWTSLFDDWVQNWRLDWYKSDSLLSSQDIFIVSGWHNDSYPDFNISFQPEESTCGNCLTDDDYKFRLNVFLEGDSGWVESDYFTILNPMPTPAELIYPTLQDTFSTHVDNNVPISFTWYPSEDIDSDDVIYTLTIELEFFGNTYTDEHENISDTTYDVLSHSLDVLLGGLNLDESTLLWYVKSSDDEYNVMSDSGQFVLTRSVLGLHDQFSIPTEFSLHQNYPNPFNPITTLRYDLPEQANVNIIIYDMLGRQVRTLINQTQDAGFKSVLWDATNDFGKPVSAGVYLYKIQAGEFVQTKKMVLLK